MCRTIRSTASFAVAAVALLTACAFEPSGLPEVPDALDAKAGGSRIVYKFTVEGDITLPSDGRDVLVTRSATDPFATDIVLDDVAFRIGAVDPATGATLGPTGDAAECTRKYPNMFERNGRSWPTTWNDNEGEWRGSANFSDKRDILNVHGFRTVGGVTEEVQSSQSSAGLVAVKSPEGVWSITFTNVLQYFGGNSTRHDDKHRCVNFKVVLTPA